MAHTSGGGGGGGSSSSEGFEEKKSDVSDEEEFANSQLLVEKIQKLREKSRTLPLLSFLSLLLHGWLGAARLM